MHDIHHHCNAQAMRLVYQSLELLRSAETRAEGEKIRDLIAERPVIGMFLQGHKLQGVVAQLMDTRQYIPTEFVERSDLLLLGTHAYMGLVDERIAVMRRESVLPAVSLRRQPHLGCEYLGLRILDTADRIGRKPLAAAAVPLHVPFEQ